jgi:cytidine deaminase
MKYDIIYSIAIDTVRNRALNRITNNQNDTISVLYTSNDTTYVGVNTADIKDGKLVNGCSEKDAIKNMLTQHENTIKAIVTINVFTLIPVLPCKECLDLILGLSPENSQCLVISPNKRYISIGDVPNYEQNVEDIEGYAESLELDPLSAISPMNVTTARNSTYMNITNMNSMATSQYMPNNGMMSQYVPNNGMVSQYMPNNGMVSQYMPNNGMVSQYMPNNGMASQYIPNNGMVSQYIPNNGMVSQYIPNNNMTSQYIPNMEPNTSTNGDDSNYLNKKLSNLLDFEEDDNEEEEKPQKEVKRNASKYPTEKAEKKVDKVEKETKRNTSRHSTEKVEKKLDDKEGKKNLLRLAKERKKQAKHAMKIDEQFKRKS